MSSKIIFNSPWYFFVLSILVALFFSLFLYYRNKKNSEAPLGVLRALAIFRFFSTFIVLLLLLNLLFRQIQNETEDPLLILAIDNSTSVVSVTDSGYMKGKFSEELSAFRSALEKKFTVRNLLFDEKIKNGTLPDFRGKETDIDHLFREVENNYSNQNIGALVLVSDGIYNKGANPLYATSRFNFPIYTIAVGDTQAVRDISIHRVNHNEVVYSGNDFPVEVVIRAQGYKGREVTVSLENGNGSMTRKNITINTDDFTTTSSFSVSAGSPGVIQYQARVSVAEGEKNTANNSRPFVIEVIDNREKILLLASAPHPDIAAIKEALSRNQNYETIHLTDRSAAKSLKEYGLVIMHGYGSAAATSLINECVTAAVPYWYVQPAEGDQLPGLRITGSANTVNDAEPVLNTDFTLFNPSEELKGLFADLPAVKTPFGKYQLSNGVNILVSQKIGSVETEDPIFYFRELNELKSAVFLGDGLWRWKMRDFAQHKSQDRFNELISKTIQYLAVKNDKSFFRISAPKVIPENNAFELRAELYNRSYELITDPEVSLTLTNSQGKKFNYTFGKLSKSYQLNVGILQPGEYRYEAKARSDNELFVKQGIVVVKKVIAEKLNTVADHQLLFQLAQRSGGKLFYPRNLQDLEREILSSESIKPVTYSQSVTSGLIDLKWLFLIILAILSIEWFIRKRYLII